MSCQTRNIHNINEQRTPVVYQPAVQDCVVDDPGSTAACLWCLLYVAMTRAEDMLVILHSGNSSYVEELYRALGTVPP